MLSATPHARRQQEQAGSRHSEQYPLGPVSGQLQDAGASSSRVVERLSRVGGGALVHVLYGLNVATSYMLMLAAMTFNVGIFAAVCTGALPARCNSGYTGATDKMISFFTCLFN